MRSIFQVRSDSPEWSTIISLSKMQIMESNDKNLPEIAGPVTFAVMLFAMVILIIWMMS